MIPQDFIDQVLVRADIVEVIEHYVPLKKSGHNYMACCPFHKEKSPSFSVSPQKQFYHCFGCGAHGNAISFLMEYGGMGFVDAVEDLAGRLGMPVPKVAGQADRQAISAKREQLSALQDYLALAVRFYKHTLKNSPEAIQYLKSRGVSGEIAARFLLGFAPSGWNSLQGVFSDYMDPALIECGLLIQKEDGARYDRFRERIMFPIRNARGVMIGFGGRVLGVGEPKYLNSPETPLFEKGRELYGLFEARQAIREKNRVLVVEGYMDVVMLAQHGISYAVATLGTATTPHHIEVLMRQADQIVFCFDGDSAGKRAAWRALENSLSRLQDGKLLSFLFLPDGHDPDSFVREYGAEAFEQAIETTALPLSVYFIRGLCELADLSTSEGRAECIRRAGPLVREVRAPALNLMIRKRLAELTKVELSEFDQLIGIVQTRASGQRGHRPPPSVQRPQISLARKVLRWIMLDPALALKVHLPEVEWEGDMAILAAVCRIAQRAEGQDLAPQQLWEYLRAAPEWQQIEAIAGVLMQHDPALSQAVDSVEFEDALKKLAGQLISARLDYLKHKDSHGGLEASEKRELLALLTRPVEP